ncbi:MAG: T9SS type A sorting domain-containing protein [Bacteroidetes bacterium]|nr:T9SS type A sorting domain-containing protein [Bacteroidota bacterium]
MYKLISGVWTQQGADIDGEAAGDGSGWPVSISADGLTVAIGATDNDGTGTDAGHVRVYQLISGVWTQQGADIDGEAADDWSGYSVSISADGLTVAIGAPDNDGTGAAAGHVRVYKLISGVWTQQGADIDGEAAGDKSGSSVSISADGLTVAIGAWLNDGAGSNAGHVRVYKLISGVWTQQEIDIDGETGGDWSGWLVSISADGLTVAIGAPKNSGSGLWDSKTGHVRVYNFQTPTGIDDNSLTGVSIWPNPTSELVNIVLGNLKDVSVKVINIIGQVVYHKENINASLHQFELNEARGVYFVEVRSLDVTRQFKLVLKK